MSAPHNQIEKALNSITDILSTGEFTTVEAIGILATVQGFVLQSSQARYLQEMADSAEDDGT